MKSNNKLGSFFGPIGAFAGIIVFIAGFISIYFSLIIGAILIIIGAFVGFSYTSVILDFDKKKFKSSNILFGFVPIGKWIQINKDLKVGFKLNKITFRTFSMSNRTSEFEQNEYRIILYDNNNKEVAEIKKSKNQKIAEIEVENISRKFNLEIF